MISRRNFLLTAAAISATAVAGTYVAMPHLRRIMRPELDMTYPLGALQDVEMRNIIALCETLIAPESKPPVEFFHDYVNTVTQSERGFLKEYQRAAALLNATSTGMYGQGAQRPFVDLSHPQRDKVLQTLLWRYPANDRIVGKVEKLSAGLDAIALRIYVMGPLIGHYYRSPYGWAVVGYESFPGRLPLDPRAYTRVLPDKGVAS